MEQYLKDEYDVVESKYLTTPGQIPEFFKNYKEYFDCGQGYYEDTHELICKIGDRFFNVLLSAEIESSKQEYGDRLYWVSGVEVQEFYETDKPLPKDKTRLNLELLVSNDQLTLLYEFLEDNNIKYIK